GYMKVGVATVAMPTVGDETVGPGAGAAGTKTLTMHLCGTAQRLYARPPEGHPIEMILARMSTWKIQNGQQQAFFDIKQRSADPLARAAKGYRGFINFTDPDDPDTIVVMSFWEDERALDDSFKTIFPPVQSDLKKILATDPEVKTLRVEYEEFPD
ncbi:MAG TPA: antibiotic biosynthesis monooxygenase family protein, partial [Methanomicrobiales archaeon]|nr:antibiotic biosynthesis monooxygenase family protein [Methanomicrobiales archaeon]